jgi:hypothetical protein
MTFPIHVRAFLTSDWEERRASDASNAVVLIRSGVTQAKKIGYFALLFVTGRRREQLLARGLRFEEEAEGTGGCRPPARYRQPKYSFSRGAAREIGVGIEKACPSGLRGMVASVAASIAELVVDSASE